ncbi:MAG: hypothetical protein AB1832_01000 [Pseudomonadota bacterium]
MPKRTDPPADSHVVTFRFRIAQDVKIAALELQGRVFARCDRGEGENNYRVIYWSNGARHDAWLYEHELSEI